MNYQTLSLTNSAPISKIALNQPQVLNALSESVLKELLNAVEELEKDSKNRVVLLSGTGKSFAAGADISAMANMNSSEALEFSKLGQTVFERIENSRLVFISLVQGFALGGGLELALATHIRIFTEKTQVGLPEVSLGLLPGFGGTQRLTRIVGRGRAFEMILTGDRIGAERAYQLGIANRVVAETELEAEAEKIAASILAKGPIAVAKAKHCILFGENNSFQEGILEERHEFSQLFENSETKEGLKAFLEKRKPNF